MAEANSGSATERRPSASITNMEVSDGSRALIDKILSGDTEAFVAIVSEYKGLVFHVVRSMIPDQMQHEDMAQAIFVRVFESLRRFRFRCSLTTWVSRIAYNMCLNHLRRSKSHPQDNPDCRTGLESLDENAETRSDCMIAAGLPTPYAEICQKELATIVTEAIERLPSTHRLVIVLHHIEGFALPEIAKSLGMSIGTIKSHLFRARAMLKTDLLKKFTIEDLLL